jgi:hypothetical protein
MRSPTAVPIPRSVYRAAKQFLRGLAFVASGTLLAAILPLVGLGEYYPSAIADLLRTRQLEVFIALGILVILTIVALLIVQAPEPPPTGGGTRVAISLLLSGGSALVAFTLLALVLTRPAWCPDAICLPPQPVLNPHAVSDGVLQLYPNASQAIQSAIFEIPGDPAGHSVANLPKNVGALRVDQADQPPYRAIVGVQNLQSSGPNVILEEVGLEVMDLPASPHPLNVWVSGSSVEYNSNPFLITYEGQAPGAVLPATYLPLPHGHVQLGPGESDTLDVQIVSHVRAALVFQIVVTYRMGDQSQIHTLRLPDRFEVIFSDAANWRIYQLQDGRLVPSGEQ